MKGAGRESEGDKTISGCSGTARFFEKYDGRVKRTPVSLPPEGARQIPPSIIFFFEK
jgi:hypothetical protein